MKNTRSLTQHSVHLKRVGSPSTILCGQAYQTERSLSDTCFICCININGLNHFLLSFHSIKRSISKLKYAVYKGSTSICTVMKHYEGAAERCQLSPQELIDMHASFQG